MLGADGRVRHFLEMPGNVGRAVSDAKNVRCEC